MESKERRDNGRERSEVREVRRENTWIGEENRGKGRRGERKMGGEKREKIIDGVGERRKGGESREVEWSRIRESGLKGDWDRGRVEWSES